MLNTPSVHSEVVHRTTIAIQSTTDGESPKGDLDHAWAQSPSISLDHSELGCPSNVVQWLWLGGRSLGG